jgi:hypothetical protein
VKLDRFSGQEVLNPAVELVGCCLYIAAYKAAEIGFSSPNAEPIRSLSSQANADRMAV